MNQQNLTELADLIYRVTDITETLDSDRVEAITTFEEISALFSDLDYLKGYLDQAHELARQIASDAINQSN